MQTRPYLCRQWLVEDARDVVLRALDAWARECGLPLQEGATDADLPSLFTAVDAQVDRLIARSDFAMPDKPYAEAFVEHTRVAFVAAKALPSIR